MKWGGYPNKKVNKFTGKILSVRGVSTLLALAAFVVLSGAAWKWTG
jgi:aconitase B